MKILALKRACKAVAIATLIYQNAAYANGNDMTEKEAAAQTSSRKEQEDAWRHERGEISNQQYKKTRKKAETANRAAEKEREERLAPKRPERAPQRGKNGAKRAVPKRA